MGRLVVFNRRINLASDDLYAPAFYGVVLHTIWLTSTGIAYSFIKDDCQVSSPLKWYAFLMVVTWGFAALVVWFTILGFFLYGSFHKSKSHSMDKRTRVWQRRLEMCCFGRDPRLTDSKDVLEEVAAELAEYFKDIDWAPTDLAAGFILLKREQKRVTEIRQARRLIVEQPAGFSIPAIDSSDTLVELAAANRGQAKRRDLLAARNSPE
ncbi:hypothetical protein HK405_002909 [Cladochytrium tenue]|nr:hypothetical protein HK405_002909 [Cladochytrium tenue]